MNVETSSGLSVTVSSKKSSHSWTFSLLCKVGWNIEYRECVHIQMFSLYNQIIFQYDIHTHAYKAGFCTAHLSVLVGPNHLFWWCACSHYLLIFVFLASRLESYTASLCSMMLTDHTSSSLVCQLGRGYKPSRKAAKNGLQERRQHVCLVTRVRVLGGIALFFLTFLVEHSTSRCALPTSIIFCFHSSILSCIIKLLLIVL